ncbi:hypothetical protein RFI_34453, partial [Reticulomyxa filosa]
VMNGIAGIWGSLLTVIATLRSAFAKDVALCVSLGENITKSVSKYMRPWLMQQQDKEFKQWVDFLFSTFCKMIGVGLALMLARVVSAFHSAIKGGNAMAHALFRVLATKKLLPTDLQNAVASGAAASSSSSSGAHLDSHAGREAIEQNGLFILLQYGLAFYGFYWQVSQGFQLRSWIFRLILLPFTLTESILTWLAAY